MPRTAIAVMSAFGLALAAGSVAAMEGPFAPPPNYYAGVSGTGPVLKAQLRTAMTNGHIQRQYGEHRFATAITDADPNTPGNILLVYNRASVPATWDNGITWNREHVWPESRQPGSVSNTTRGNLGDHHALKPCNPSINSSRGNKPFGDANTTGAHGSLGSYYFPGDLDKGDIARILFYSDTRWGADLGLSLVDTFPSGFQMGGLASIVAWHYLDPPDDFEIRRNHAIFSQQMNPLYYTNNRNAFIDMPEVVWSVYVNQNNDSTLWVGDAPGPDGASSVSLEASILLGASVDPQAVTLHKAGQAGTYYRVDAGPGLTSSISGRHNAFAIGEWDTAREIEITVDPAALAAPGLFNSQIIITNLDLTTGAGLGRGAQDADDTITVEIGVYELAVVSFDPNAVVDDLLVQFGVIELGSGPASEQIDLFNIAPLAFGARADIELVGAAGDTAALAVDFDPVFSLAPGGVAGLTATLSDAVQGEFGAVYTFRVFNDRSVFADPGDATDLVLRLAGTVGGQVCIPDLSPPFGVLNFFDVAAFLSLYTAQDPQADMNDDGQINFFDVSAYITLYNAGCP